MLLAAFSFSFLPLFNAIGLEKSSPVFFSLMTYCTSGILSSALLIAISKKKNYLLKMVKTLFSFRNDILMTAFLTGLTQYVSFLLFLISMSMMSKVGAAMIMESWPIFAVLLAPVLINRPWKSLYASEFILGFVCLTGLYFVLMSETSSSMQDMLSSPFAPFIGDDLTAKFGIIFAFLAAFCMAYTGILRMEIANKMPKSSRRNLFGKTGSLLESVFCYWVASVICIPLALITLLIMEPNFDFVSPSIPTAFLNGVILTSTAVFFGLSILKTSNSAIILLWYIAPVMAIFWLIAFGFSNPNGFFFFGATLILVSNVALAMINAKKEKPAVEILQEEQKTLD